MTLTNLRRCLHFNFFHERKNVYAIRPSHYVIFYLLDLLFIFYNLLPLSVGEQFQCMCFCDGISCVFHTLEIDHTFNTHIDTLVRSNT